MNVLFFLTFIICFYLPKHVLSKLEARLWWVQATFVFNQRYLGKSVFARFGHSAQEPDGVSVAFKHAVSFVGLKSHTSNLVR